MAVIEIVGGVILLVISVVIFALTRIAGIIFFVVAILACVFASRLA